MLSIIGFVVILIPLVVVHELGHFLFAKLFNVRADAFSIGFGPVIFAKKWGETDFRLSAIPLGGYVKLLGEDPNAPLSDEEKKRALHNQVPWKRFFIFFGGPLFNFLWAIIVFMAMMAIGEPQVANQIGRVLPDSPAARAGFLANDQIVTVAGAPVVKFEEIIQKLSDLPNQKVKMEVSRVGQIVPLEVQTGEEDGFSVYGEPKKVGTVEGWVANPRVPKIGISDPASKAAQSGLVTGDEIVELAGKPVKTFEDVEMIYASLKGEQIAFKVKKADGKLLDIELKGKLSGSLAQDFGLHSSELFVDQTLKGAPAEQAGLLRGDRMVSVNGEAVRSFFELRQKIQLAGEKGGPLALAVERQGKVETLHMVPQESAERDPMLKKRVQYTVGVMPVQTLSEPVMMIERIYNPFVLLAKGTMRMLEMSERNLVSIGKMFVGKVSVKSLGGPILIGKLAGDSLSRGLMDFLRMMAVLSIGLGILNILPIPVLDGGHIVLLGIEAIRGKALPLKQVEIAQQVGLALILLIMVIVMKNDISRLPIFN